MEINFEYIETENKDIAPVGENWEYWGDRITPEVHVAVWRRVAEGDDDM